MSAPMKKKLFSIKVNFKAKQSDRIHLHICEHKGCDKTFNRADRLKIHLRTHTGERPFICDYGKCSKSYARASHLKRHQEIAHLEGTQKLEKLRCTEENCTQEFTLPGSLKRHMRCQHQDNEFECSFPDCGKVFKKHQQLKTHEYEHSDIDPYRCPHKGCEKLFRLPSRLKRHMKVHSGYNCYVEGCGVTCATWSQFRSHTKHTHPRAYLCEECGETFQSKKWLQKHSQLHEKTTEIFVCPREGCHRSYLTLYGAKAHIRSYHEGIKYECSFPECLRKFSSKQRLKIHEQMHDPNIPPVRKKPRKSTKKRSMAFKIAGLLDKKKEQELSETTTDDEFLLEVRRKGKPVTSSSMLDCQELRRTSESLTPATVCARRVSGDSDIASDRRVVLVNSTIDSVKAMSIEPVNLTIGSTEPMPIEHLNSNMEKVTTRENECVNQPIVSAETATPNCVKQSIDCAKPKQLESLNQNIVSDESIHKESVIDVDSGERMSVTSVCQSIVSNGNMETESLNQVIVSGETPTTESVKQTIACTKSL